MGFTEHYRHVKPHEYETTHRDMLRASTDELIARGYDKLLEEDELKVLAQYHLEKFKNYMRPLIDRAAISSEMIIKMPRCES
tara:strand:+ start:341 stop:586 length:246 start_codon:yes stop_codon:yes gene_type:complete